MKECVCKDNVKIIIEYFSSVWKVCIAVTRASGRIERGRVGPLSRSLLAQRKKWNYLHKVPGRSVQFLSVFPPSPPKETLTFTSFNHFWNLGQTVNWDMTSFLVISYIELLKGNKNPVPLKLGRMWGTLGEFEIDNLMCVKRLPFSKKNNNN